MNKDIADHFVQMHEEIYHGKRATQEQTKLEKNKHVNNIIITKLTDYT